MAALTNIQNNPHRDFYEIPDKDSITDKVGLVFATAVSAVVIILIIIALSTNQLGNIPSAYRPLCGMLIPFTGFAFSIFFWRTLYSLSPSYRESFVLHNTISEEKVEKIKKANSLAEVKKQIMIFGYHGDRRSVNLGEHVRNGKLTPENIQFLDRMMVEYYRLLNERYSALGILDNNVRMTTFAAIDKKMEFLEAEWQKERSTWK